MQASAEGRKSCLQYSSPRSFSGLNSSDNPCHMEFAGLLDVRGPLEKRFLVIPESVFLFFPLLIPDSFFSRVSFFYLPLPPQLSRVKFKTRSLGYCVSSSIDSLTVNDTLGFAGMFSRQPRRLRSTRSRPFWEYPLRLHPMWIFIFSRKTTSFEHPFVL